MKAATLFCLLTVSFLLKAQSFRLETDGIPVSIDNKTFQNPWNGGYNQLTIAMPDIDGDGDNDLFFVATPEGKLNWYRNDGEGSNGKFTLVDTNLSQINLGVNNNWISFEDIDFDNDFDLFIGSNDGRIKYFENTGSSQIPNFKLISNFFEDIDIGFTSSPTFADLDGDGLNDLIVGSYQEGYFWHKRRDSLSSTFEFIDTLRDQAGSIIKPGSIFYTSYLVDIDHDNDLDLFTGSSDPGISFYRNIGTKNAPVFLLEQQEFISTDNFLDFIHPVLVDIDKDNDYDLFFGSNFGAITYFKNNGTPTNPKMELEKIQIPLDYLDFGYYATPTLIDIDNDGDQDLLVSPDYGKLFYYFENTGTASSPFFTYRHDHFINDWINFGSYPTWADLDGDGDIDLIGGNSSREVYFYENSGTALVPKFIASLQIKDNMSSNVNAYRPQFADLDDDGDFDLYYVARNGDLPDVIRKYGNDGTARNYKFTSTNDTLKDDSGQLIGDYDMYFQFIDFDRDMDLDLMIGGAEGKVIYYENVGTKALPSFHLKGNNFIPVAGSGNDRAIPFLTDIDDDTDMDLFLGRFQGGLFFYRNLEFPIVSGVDHQDQAQFQLLQNHPNPFSNTTSINFYLSASTNAKIVIYDMAGRLIATPLNQKLSPGMHTLVLDDFNLQPGYYLYSLITSQGQSTKKMLLIKE
ncbi:MAG: T9SS type A sorting domain-containing protein [Saprospiraceae bacterium]|nr:T9SS type A sorting domain-containing protein [Saprospiraceae bacterium]